MPLTLKYDEQEFATVILEQASHVSELVQYGCWESPGRTVWLHAVEVKRGGPWRIQAWKGDPTNADLLEEQVHDAAGICRSMEYLCSDISRGIRVIDGGSTLVAENIAEAVVRQDPEVLTPEVCDAILQMAIWGDVLHK